MLVTVVIVFAACNDKEGDKKEEPHATSSLNHNNKDMNSFVSIIEIPATDISRAIIFYQTILGIEIEEMSFTGMEMGLFPYEDQIVTAIITQAEGYEPSDQGPIIYLNAGDNLQPVLDKISASGGKVILPKTAHADESGFFALFLDSEGNKMGLNSTN